MVVHQIRVNNNYIFAIKGKNKKEQKWETYKLKKAFGFGLVKKDKSTGIWFVVMPNVPLNIILTKVGYLTQEKGYLFKVGEDISSLMF